MYRIVIAPDSFKGSISAKEACDAIESGIKRVSNNVDIVKIPMADGGEGTVQSLVDCKKGKLIYKKVLDPLGNPMEASLGFIDNNTAVIEMASASGLPLVQMDKRNPLITTTYGTGELIKHGLDLGARKFIIGIGGSATVDGGVGMLQALGIKFLDERGFEIGFGGGSLGKIHSIDMTSIDSRINESEFLIACDVDNPLLGKEGSARIFGPQKGATKEMVEILEENLRNFSQLTQSFLDKDYSKYPGAGAAGGLGFGFISFLKSRLVRGIDIIIEETNLENYIKTSSLVITGEGQIDSQSLHGKTPIGIANVAKKYNVPTIVLAGTIDKNIDRIYKEGVTSVFSILKAPVTLEYAVENTFSLLSDISERVFRTIIHFDSNKF